MFGWGKRLKDVTYVPQEAHDLGLIEQYKAYMLDSLQAHPELKELEDVALKDGKLHLIGPREGWVDHDLAGRLASEYTTRWVA